MDYSEYSDYIMHADVNSAYLAWIAGYRLQHGDPVDLRTIPSVVGGDEKSRHGIVLAKSIPAKAYKIQTGESLHAIRQRCPGIVIVPPDYPLFMQASAAFFEMLSEYSPKVQVFSIDEGFFEFKGMKHLWPDPVQAAYTIKEDVKNRLGFTINIGISTNKLLAKMAGELEKPDKVHTLFPHEIPAKMWPFPVEELYMVGRATASKLHGMGIYTIGQLANTDPEFLKFKFKSAGKVLHDFANGREDSLVGARPPLKGVGNSTTISFDVEAREEAYKVLLSLTETVCMRLRQTGCCAQLIAVSTTTSEFISRSHQRKLVMPTDSTTDIYHMACVLLNEFWKGEPIRKLGVHVSELCDKACVQLTIFERYNERKHRLDEAIDGIRKEHGPCSVFRSSFLHSGLSPLAGGVMQEDYQMMSSIL